MKRFGKTTAGKTILFILCIISLGVLLLSGISAAFLFEEDFYSRDREEIYEDIIDGRLGSDLYEVIWDLSDQEDMMTQPVSDKGNLAYRISDSTGKIISMSESASSVSYFDGTLSYYALLDENGNVVEVFRNDYPMLDESRKYEIYNAEYKILEGTGRVDFYSFSRTLFEIAYTLRYGLYGIILLSGLLLIGTFVTLMSVSGRVNDSDEIHAGPLNIIPFDLLCVGAVTAFVLYCVMCDSFGMSSAMLLILILAGFLFGACGFLGLCMSAACRIKQRTLLKKSFCWWVIRKCMAIMMWLLVLAKKMVCGIISFIRQIPLVWKSVLFLCGYSAVELFFLMNDAFSIFWFFKTIILIPAALYLVMCMRRLQKGGEALAAGDLSYHVDTKHMYYDLKQHGEDLNSIAKGMAIAVEDRMKSERMKTELITNVSHDIKTPLTSIINYADLISKEKGLNKKAKEYAEVLVKQSERLKRLLEDLVEASKASTGNLEVEMVPCDASMFISQSEGEYADRFENAKLTLITEKPDHEVMIMADGRRMWRIFDNLMNNICKYALAGTRVYLSLKEEGDRALITFKNTSRDELNISEEELMERFTRGDASRNTEGNGLGLSIARSLCELQNGKMDLSIDGDLFKVTLSFPKIQMRDR